MKKQYITPLTEGYEVEVQNLLVENSGEVSGEDALVKQQMLWDDEDEEPVVKSPKTNLWDDDDY